MPRCQSNQVLELLLRPNTLLFIQVTLISAFVFPQLPPKPLNIFFAVCISLSSITACILIYWYRQGDLEPKFRNLIYYILFSIIMLCICANLYFHDVGKWGSKRYTHQVSSKQYIWTRIKSWIRNAEESPAKVWYMIFMLIVNLNSLLQGRHILNHFAFSLRSWCCT